MKEFVFKGRRIDGKHLHIEADKVEMRDDGIMLRAHFLLANGEEVATYSIHRAHPDFDRFKLAVETWARLA